MRRTTARVLSIMAVVLLLNTTVLELNSEARAGGSRSTGSRGGQGHTRPAVSPSYQSPRQQATSTPSTFQQPAAGGGFMRSMAGGMMGGMLGSMLFSSFAGAGGAMGGGGGGGGLGLFGIIILAGGAYLLFRLLRKRS